MLNVKKSNSMKKTSTTTILLLLVALLSVTGACTLHTYDDPFVMEPQYPERPPKPHATETQNHGRSYTMKQKLFFLYDEYIIRDQDNYPVFSVIKKQFTFGNKFSFRDERGRELAYISEKVLSLMPKYKILRDGHEVASIKKQFKLFQTEFTMKIAGEPNITISGDFFNYNYQFTREGRIVAEVTRKPFSLLDTYWIEVAPRENDVLILAAAAVIDMVCHSPENDSDHHHHHH